MLIISPLKRPPLVDVLLHSSFHKHVTRTGILLLSLFLLSLFPYHSFIRNIFVLWLFLMFHFNHVSSSTLHALQKTSKTCLSCPWTEKCHTSLADSWSVSMPHCPVFILQVSSAALSSNGHVYETIQFHVQFLNYNGCSGCSHSSSFVPALNCNKITPYPHSHPIRSSVEPSWKKKGSMKCL